MASLAKRYKFATTTLNGVNRQRTDMKQHIREKSQNKQTGVAIVLVGVVRVKLAPHQFLRKFQLLLTLTPGG